jgi:hypothetical protein
MKITNRFNLPEVFENFVRADKYTRGKSDISVTQLIDSPSIRIKRQQFEDYLEMDGPGLVFVRHCRSPCLGKHR